MLSEDHFQKVTRNTEFKLANRSCLTLLQPGELTGLKQWQSRPTLNRKVHTTISVFTRGTQRRPSVFPAEHV